MSEDETMGTFEEFLQEAEPRLRRALSAAYGGTAGRDAAIEALAWAWEHWDRVADMSNPVGSLYRVGQTEARRLPRRPGCAPLICTRRRSWPRAPTASPSRDAWRAKASSSRRRRCHNRPKHQVDIRTIQRDLTTPFNDDIALGLRQGPNPCDPTGPAAISIFDLDLITDAGNTRPTVSYPEGWNPKLTGYGTDLARGGRDGYVNCG